MIIIAAGGNLPFQGSPPDTTIARAFDALEARGDIRVAARSRIYSSPAWPDPSAPAYANAAARVETELSPQDLLARLHAVEEMFGRVRSADDRWAARTLDLDLIDHDGRVVDAPDLTLPHPRAAGRAFVLIPLRDAAPDWRSPDGRGLEALIAELPADDIAATTLLQRRSTP